VVGRIRFALERFASPRHRSHVAQLFSLGSKASPEIFRSDFAAEFFGGSPESFGLS